jgi:hypothetical protein
VLVLWCGLFDPLVRRGEWAVEKCDDNCRKLTVTAQH